MNQNQPQKRTTQSPLTRPQKVLVVDDDPIMRDMMVDILECEGYSPELASNGQEALRLLRGQDNYLVFLDLMMPVFTGKELCAMLSNQPELRQRHILVLMSAMDRVEETYDLDVDMVMPKPFVVDDVTEALDAFMR